MAQVKVSILGDSYSTFENWIPEGNEPWYGPAIGNDVKQVEDTWWFRLIEDNGLQLEKNDSWSGATISYTGYGGEDYSPRSFITRADRLGDNPDIIFVFGGTNDAWAGAPIGEFNGTDLYSVRPAIRELFRRLRANYPDALTVAIINTELTPQVESSLLTIAAEEDVPVVRLTAIDKQSGHPSIHGMSQIAAQTWKATAPLLYEKLRNR